MRKRTIEAIVTETPFQDYPVLVAALYRFAPVADPAALRERLIALCGEEVRGTLLVAHEGINGTIAGPHDAILRVVNGIQTRVKLRQQRLPQIEAWLKQHGV